MSTAQIDTLRIRLTRRHSVKKHTSSQKDALPGRLEAALVLNGQILPHVAHVSDIVLARHQSRATLFPLTCLCGDAGCMGHEDEVVHKRLDNRILWIVPDTGKSLEDYGKPTLVFDADAFDAEIDAVHEALKTFEKQDWHPECLLSVVDDLTELAGYTHSQHVRALEPEWTQRSLLLAAVEDAENAFGPFRVSYSWFGDDRCVTDAIALVTHLFRLWSLPTPTPDPTSVHKTVQALFAYQENGNGAGLIQTLHRLLPDMKPGSVTATSSPHQPRHILLA